MGLLKEAENQMAYCKAGILGFPGSGKSFTAMLIGRGICEILKNQSLAFYDTETGSDFFVSKMKADGFKFYQLKSRSFNDLCSYIKEVEAAKIPVLIIDSITHVWRELCEAYDKKLNRRGRLQFQDWAVIKGEWKEYTDLFVNSKVHIIVCGRAGYEYDYDFNEDGTKDLIKTATRMKVESEFAFEPSLVIEMERTSQSKDELKEYMGKTDYKSKTAKQTHKAETGSKWIHRAYVLKDRTDTLNGQIFDYPTFKDFLPHFKALNIGGEHLGVDTSRTSTDRFDIEGKPEWKKDQEQKKIALEEIENWLTTYFPGTGGKEKKAKIKVISYVFGKPSWTYVETLRLDAVITGRNRIKSILETGSNIPILMGEVEGEITEPEIKKEEEDIPMFPVSGEVRA